MTIFHLHKRTELVFEYHQQYYSLEGGYTNEHIKMISSDTYLHYFGVDLVPQITITAQCHDINIHCCSRDTELLRA